MRGTPLPLRGGHRRWLIGATLTVVGTLWMAQPAYSIPAFARKYETSCHTCHTVYPKLNPFGNAFRMKGYRMPGETEEMIKEEPVTLGADANRRLWPKALWPSSIPGSVPLSFDVRLSMVTEHDEESGSTFSNDMRFPEAVELLAGGTFGNTISYLAALEAEIEGEHGESSVELGVGHAEAHFNGPFDTGSKFNLKIGRFTPEATQQLNHGYLAADSIPAVMFGFNPIGFHGSSQVGSGGHHGGGSGIALPAGVDGLEIYGILDHRFEYSAGVANGAGPGEGTRDGNESKDVFGRIGYKFGGMTLDGEGQADYQADSKNWREKSLRVGVFGYKGDGEGVLFEGTGHHADEFAENRDFERYGFDLNAYFKDVNLILGYVKGDDRLAEFVVEEEEEGEEGEEGEEHEEEPLLVFSEVDDFEWEAWFAELDVVVFPWLHGAVRYEWLDPSDPRSEDFERYVINLSALIRANVKALLEYQTDTGGETEDNYEIRAVVRFAF